MTKIKENALKEPRKIITGGRDVRSNYLFCQRLCPSCKYFEDSESDWPYKCSQGTSDNIANRSKQENYRQYDECKYYKEKGDEIEAYNPLKNIFTNKEEANSSIDNIVVARNREMKNEDEVWERKQEEKRRQAEEQEREERQQQEEEEYNHTHCYSCGEKGMLVEFNGKYFHEKCLEIFKNSENGKKWIHEKELANERKRIADENSEKVFQIVKKYSVIWSQTYIDFYKEFIGIKSFDYVNLFQTVDIEKFTLFMENKFKKAKTEKEAVETAKKEQEEQERQKKEAEEKSKIESENKRKIHKAGTKKRRFWRIIIIILALIPLGIFGNGFIGIFSIIFVIIFWKIIGKWTGEFKE